MKLKKVRWKFYDDVFIAQFYDDMGPEFLARNDFHCAPKQVQNRYEKLKRNGLIEPLRRYAMKAHAIEMAASRKLEKEYRAVAEIYCFALNPSAQQSLFPPQ